ncbi:MAG: SLC13 family permease [Myxococcota bacterium]|nr:SLC13 family permease [Myxococcota bacterium]
MNNYKKKSELKRTAIMLLGVVLFCAVYFLPNLPPAMDPKGESFPLTHEGKAAVALFLLTVVWWVSEVVPIGITSITVGVIQALFLIRPAKVAFTDFMDPSVWFIFASLVIGTVFTKTGLTKRMAYRMLGVVGEKTSMIFLGCFIMTSAMTLVMAHTAVAATLYPLFLAVNSLYSDEEKPTRFGRGLFMGMAFVAGAGSIITLLGAARGAVALGFFKDITGRTIGFFELSYYMLPVGVVMTFLLWVFFMVYCRPEQKTIPGLKDRVQVLYKRLGPITRGEILSLVIVLSAIAVLGVCSLVPAFKTVSKSAVLLVTTISFFVLRILKLEDLEKTSWNIILLFGGAMSIGFCLWQTGAAKWIAVHWLTMFENSPGFVFIMGISFFVLIMTNLIMNVAAIAISLPVALMIAPYVGVSADVILYASLVTAGMPFLLLVGAAPNAIAYASGQFTTRQFFIAGIPASLLLMVVLAVFVWAIWPAMGMPVTTN